MDMPSVPQPSQGDPLGCRAALEEALAAAALDAFDSSAPAGEGRELLRPATPVGTTPAVRSAEAAAAAYQVAVALGFCRLFGVDPGDLDGVLPPGMAVAAARQLSSLLDHWTNEDVPTLPQRWEDAAHPAEAEEMCLELLEARMEAWAAYIAIDEAFAEMLESPDAPVDPQFMSALAHELDDLPAAFDEFDDALTEQIPLLATAVDTELLNNWRAFLAEPFRERLPWWLDGTLEKAAEHAYRQMLAELPALQPRTSMPTTVPVETPSAALAAYRRAFARREQIAAAAEEQPPLAILRWDSPDAAYYAFLPLPVGTPTEIVLSFFTCSHEAATELAGAEVQLDGVESVIEPDGRARFSYDRLRAAERLEAVLLVGRERTAWLVQPVEA